MNYYDDEQPRKPFDQDNEVDYYGMYKQISKDESININEFSRKKQAPKKRPAGKKKRKKMSKKKLALTIIAGFLAVIFLTVLGFYLWIHFNLNHDDTKWSNDDLGFENVIDENVLNVALFGIDTREPGVFEGLSDSIMILSINTKTKEIKVISLMRDTITKIDDKKNNRVFYAKLNQAYATGGPELAMRTINMTYNLDISEYATVNFFGMVEIIDAVGGIEAEITEDELTWQGYDNPNLNNCMEEICEAKGLDVDDYIITTPGKQHLNGVQAVAYSRIRHCLSAFGTNDDFGRTDRQRHVMEQLFSKAIKMNKARYIKLIKELLPVTKTSLDEKEITSLAVNVLLNNPKLYKVRIPQLEWKMEFYHPEYGSCVYFDKEYASRAIHAIIYEGMTAEKFVEKHPIEFKDWFLSETGEPSVQAYEWSESESGVTSQPTENTETTTEQTEYTETTTEQTENTETSTGEENTQNTEEQG